ncbi:MAG TPA: LPS export ABC transporter permease LptG [Gammaproteobacteria bacterium]|nr:LPS export ABC transporter permease LptG [Gammaproteobacteria bacterium]
MFRRLDRYIGWTIARATGMTILVLVILLSFIGLVDELDRTGRGAYGVGDALLVALLTSPRYLFEVFPVSALLGSLLGLGALASHSELVAMRAAGFSLLDILLAVAKVGLLMMLVVVAFSELVAPPAEQYAQALRTEKLLGGQALSDRYGFWARDGQAFVNIRSLGDGRHLRDVLIYEFDRDGSLRLATRAASAEYREGHWELRDLAQSELSPLRVQTRRLAGARWDSVLDPALLASVKVRPTMLPVWELKDYIDFLRRNAQSAVDYEVAFWLKVVNPFATLAMLFLSVPFVLGNLRQVGVGQRIFVGAVVGAAFFLLTRAFSYLAIVYQFNPALTVAFPALVFFGLAALLLRRVR